MTRRAAHLSTRQQWVLQAVADGRIHHDRIYGDLAPYDLDGHPVDWTLTGLAVRGLVGFDPLLPGPAHLTPRGLHTLTAGTDLQTRSAGTDHHPRRRPWPTRHRNQVSSPPTVIPMPSTLTPRSPSTP